MSEPSPFWKQKVIQLSYGLLPMLPYEIHDCFPSIRPRSLVFTAVSLINIIVITCVSVIFTPSSFPKQISLGKKKNRFNQQPHAGDECLFFSFTSRCSSALTNTMTTSVRAHIAPVPLAWCAFVSQRTWYQVLLNCLSTVIQAHVEILNICLAFLRLCTSVASAKCCNFC